MTMKKTRDPPVLPSRQLAILAICRFAEPVASTSVFPYLPEMIESFGVDKSQVAKWAGITSAAFSLSQCLTAVAWGRASDNFGRKPVILTCLGITMLTSLFWGFSRSLAWAVAARIIAGAANGNVGIIRTTVAELCPEKELQPRAFSIMPLVWSIGSIFGPAFGGFLAQPAENFPQLFGHNKFFIKFPFMLPNLVAAVFFMIGIMTGILFLKETLAAKKHRPDYGLILGEKLTGLFKRKPQRARKYNQDSEASVSLLRPASTYSNSSMSHDDHYATSPEIKKALGPPSVREVLTTQSTINLLAYTLLALHSAAFDQLLPVFLHSAPQPPGSPATRLPFRFTGGFGLHSSQIGTLFTAYGVCGGFVQFVVFPPVARRFGVLRCFRACCVVFPLVYVATPYTALLGGGGSGGAPALQQAAMLALMVVKSVAVIFAFPCSTILLTNSARSLRVLGTLNGFATSTSALGRAAGPALGGAAFTWGESQGYGVTPWFVLALVAALGVIPVFYLLEMPGFSSEADEDDEDEDDDDDLGGDEGQDQDGNLPRIDEIPPDRTIVEGDESVRRDDVEEEAIDTVEGPPLSRMASRSSTGRPSFTRMSSPIGIKTDGIGPGGGRRLSNGLGYSNMGQGAGGTSFT